MPFPSAECEAFNGLCLVIVRGKQGKAGRIRFVADSESLESAAVFLENKVD